MTKWRQHEHKCMVCQLSVKHGIHACSFGPQSRGTKSCRFAIRVHAYRVSGGRKTLVCPSASFNTTVPPSLKRRIREADLGPTGSSLGLVTENHSSSPPLLPSPLGAQRPSCPRQICCITTCNWPQLHFQLPTTAFATAPALGPLAPPFEAGLAPHCEPPGVHSMLHN